MNIQVVTQDANQKESQKFLTTVGCDQLAFLLFDFKKNCFVKYLECLNEDEINIIKTTYGAESISVQKGQEEFKPNIVSINDLLPVLLKLRTKVIYDRIKEETQHGNEYELTKLHRDLIAISECIGVLEFSKNTAPKAYLAIVDY